MPVTSVQPLLETPPESTSTESTQHSHRSDNLLEKARAIADCAAIHAASIDCIGAFPEEGFKQLAASGFLQAPLRSELGGLGLGFQSHQTWLTLRILKHIGRGNLSMGRVYEGHVNALQLVQTFGTSAQVKKYAQDARNNKVFGVWNAEAEDGVKLIPIGSGSYRIEGSKTFCSGCGYVERPFVNGALPDGQWQMCIVPMEKVSVDVDPSWWQPSGMRASASYKVDFTGVELTAEDILAQPADYFRQPWLTAGVIRFAAVQLGGAEALFDATRTYLQGMGRIDHPHQQARLGKMAIALEQGNLWLQGSAHQVNSYAPIFGGPYTSPETTHTESAQASESQINTAQLVSYANMTRTAIEQICIDMMQLAERCVGTRGLLPPHPMERIIRDLTLYLRQPAFDISLTSVGQHVLEQTQPASELWT
ncbi:MAG: acyl-CoA dehydrogenase family protein [Phormidesmis sp.]